MHDWESAEAAPLIIESLIINWLEVGGAGFNDHLTQKLFGRLLFF